MTLKLLVATFAVLSITGGCTVHFPLADHVPTLQGTDDSPSPASMRLAPTEPDTRNPLKGNGSDMPD